MKVAPAIALLVLLAATTLPAAGEQGPNPRDSPRQDLPGAIRDVAVAAKTGHVLAVASDPAGSDPTAPADAPVWALWSASGAQLQAGSADPANCIPTLSCRWHATHAAISDDGTRFAFSSCDVTRSCMVSRVHFGTISQGTVSSWTQEVDHPIRDLDMSASGAVVAALVQERDMLDEQGYVYPYTWNSGSAPSAQSEVELESDAAARALDLGADGKQAVAATAASHERIVLSGPTVKDDPDAGAVTAVAVSGTAPYWSIAGNGDGDLILYQEGTAPGEREASTRPRSSSVAAVAMTDDASHYAVAYEDGWVHLYGKPSNGTSGPQVAAVQGADGASHLAFGRDGRHLAVAAGDRVDLYGVSAAGLALLWSHSDPDRGDVAGLGLDASAEFVAAGRGTNVTVYEASHVVRAVVDDIEVSPGSRKQLEATYFNDGNRPEHARLDVDYPSGLVVFIDRQNVSLDPGETAEVDIDVVAKDGMAPGTYAIKLLQTLDSGFVTQSPFNVTVPSVERLSLSPDGSTSLGLDAGDVAVFEADLVNVGNIATQWSLDADADDGWQVTLNRPQGELEAGETEEIRVTLRAPQDADQGDQGVVTLGIAGDDRPPLQFVGTVGARFEFQVDAPAGVSLPPGNQTRFTVTVRNIGNAPDSYTLGLGQTLPMGWNAVFEGGQSTVQLNGVADGASAEAAVLVRAPADADAGTSRALSVEAVSGAEGSRSESRTVVLTVEDPDNGTTTDSGNGTPGPAVPLLALAVLAAAAVWMRRRD